MPVGCSIFPKEIFRTSRRWAEGRFKDLRFWSEPEKGGHFAAFEQPERFVQDLRECFREDALNPKDGTTGYRGARPSGWSGQRPVDHSGIVWVAGS